MASHTIHVIKRRLLRTKHALEFLVFLDLFPDPVRVVVDVGFSLDDLLLFAQPIQQVLP